MHRFDVRGQATPCRFQAACSLQPSVEAQLASEDGDVLAPEEADRGRGKRSRAYTVDAGCPPELGRLL